MRRTILIFVLLGLVGSYGWSYIRLNTYETSIVNLQRVDNTGIQFYLNNQIAPALQSNASGKNVTVIAADSDPQGAAAAAAAAWNAVGTANVKFLPIMTTTAVHNSNDGMAVISLATASADISAVGGAVAITVDSWATGPANLVNGQLLSCTSNCMFPADGDIVDSDILLSPAVAFSTNGATGTDLQAALTHEMGHSLGANHTGVLGAAMFQYTSLNQRFLSTDDLAFVNSVYPGTSGGAPLGTISGKITLAGTLPIPYALLTFIDTAHGTTLGGLSNPDGTFSIQAPPGNYIMYAEPFNIVQPANLYFTAAEALLTQLIQPTLLGSASNPTAISVTANGTATADLAVTAAGSLPFSLPFIGFGGAGKNGDIRNVVQLGGPMEIASGQTFDLGINGAGFDQTTTVAVYGPGITAGPVRVDSAVNFGGSPLLRTTLTVAASQRPALATILLTKGGQTLALTGVLVIGPVQPVFAASNVVNAGITTSNGVVAPGEIVSIYGANMGLAAATFYTFSSANILSKEVGNTRVLFDGTPASLLFSSSGQVNAIVPYEVAGKSTTQMQVEYEGVQSAAVPVTVSATSPGILFGALPQQGLAQNNVDFSVNGPTNPVARGAFVVLYGTGEGQTNPGGVDGLGQAGFNNTNRLPVAALSATVGGLPAPFAAAATVDVSGLAQIDVQIPSGLTTTGAVPVVVTIGGVASAPFNIYVK